MTTTRYLSVAILLAMVIGQGCGKRDEGPEKIRALEEKHVREIAQLEETHGARIKNYEQMLAARDRELRALSGQLAAAGDSGAVKKAPPAGLKASESPQAPAVTPATSPLAGAAKISPGGIDINLLEQFAEEYVSSLGESDREKFTKDARALIASLQATTDASPPLQRKEELMRSLQERISASGYDREKSALENRLKCIEGASEDDLPGVLDYYQKLDNIDTVNRFMQDYNISREELSEYGIEPPPRSRMRPDAKEIANSLRSFVEDYAPLVDSARREQYRTEFNSIAANLSARLTDEQVMQGKEQMVQDLQARYATAPERERQRIKNRIERLETADIDSVRPRLQYEMMREINTLVKKYNIPGDELRQTGVLYPGGRRF